MFLKNFHIFIKKRAVLQQKFTVQVTTLADCDDITRFDGTPSIKNISERNKIDTQSRADANIKRKRLFDYNFKSGCT
jgi:hypothetical protein